MQMTCSLLRTMLKTRSQDSKGDEGGIGKFVVMLIAGIFALIIVTIVVPNVLGVSINHLCVVPDSVFADTTTLHCEVDGDGVATGPPADGSVFLPENVRTIVADLVSTLLVVVAVGMILVGAVMTLRYRIIPAPVISAKNTALKGTA